MKVILDTNIFFSALIKPDGKIAEIILNPAFHFEKYTCYYLYIELFKHKDKILKVSKLSESELLEVFYALIRRVAFINESHIPKDIYQFAYELVKDIDPNDTPFVALNTHLNAYLWTGDLQLRDKLKTKGYQNVISTRELLELLETAS